MKLRSLILLLGVCLPHWTTAYYQVNMDGDILKGVTISSEIDLSNRKIRQIDNNAFDALTHIKTLNLSNNALEALPSSIFSKLVNLEELVLAYNSITSFDKKTFDGLNNLKRLDISYNQIHSLSTSDLTGLTNATEVVIDGNGLSSLYVGPPLDWSSVSHADPRNAHLFSYESGNERMPETFRVQLCMTNDGIVQSLEEIKENQSLSNGTVQFFEQFKQNQSLSNDTIQSVEELKQNQSVVKCIVIEPYHSERAINLMKHNITKFKRGWYKLPGNFVRAISLADNEITEITAELLNDLPSNMMVDLSSNKITTVKKNIIENKYCVGLDLAWNILETIEDGAFDKICLSALFLRHNRLNNLNFIRTLPIMIERLDLSQNNFTEIPSNIFRGLKKLEFIGLSRNKLERIEPGTFEDQENLISIDLNFNRISELQFELFKNSPVLETISLLSNKITKITRNTSGLKTSRKLNIFLSNNNIDTIEEGSFSHLNISFLELGGNKITDESIASGAFNMTTIETLGLEENSISSLNGESFSGILGSYTLNLDENPIKNIKNFFG